MAQPEKNIIFAYGTTGLVDITFRIQRDRDDYLLDNDDGTFKEVPTTPDIPAVEDPDNDGVYRHDESREDWEFANDRYTVYAYKSGVLVGQGKLSLAYGNGSVHLEGVNAAGVSPLPTGAATELSLGKLTPSTNHPLEMNEVSNPISTLDTGKYYTNPTTTAFGFSSRAVFVYNKDDTNDLEASFDAGVTWITIAPLASISLEIEFTGIDVRSAITGPSYQVLAI